ncbi:uncharacterized protein LOC129905701 [Episyrphus balteatus]|uniref:uncharacterized protein LOC129905701 n=1 Tax=Episyrphus balteatus TaxID=286459 RepID=UPI00248556B3|nr:uncharacterized protein LOC129905701 [Episyrphus balteatus]
MRAACFVLLIVAAVVSADVKLGVYPVPYSADVVEEPAKFSNSEEFINVVDYLNENASGNDLYEIIECFNDALDDLENQPEGRSLSSIAHEIFEEIPWSKINSYVMSKLSSNPKFAKVYAILNDPEFKDLLNKAVNSVALRNYVKSVEANGFSWSTFASFALKAICDTAVVSHHDSYSEGVCKVLKSL